jgi:hypothetical protein
LADTVDLIGWLEWLLKKRRNCILMSLNLVLPYHPAEKKTELLPGYDGSYYPEGLEKVPRRYAIIRANKIMVDSSDWLVCYEKHGASNSRKVLEYAQKRAGKGLIHIENLAEAF